MFSTSSLKWKLERWDNVWSHLQTRHRHVSTYTRHSQSWCHSRWPFDDVIHEQIKETPPYRTSSLYIGQSAPAPVDQRSLHTCTCWSRAMTSYRLLVHVGICDPLLYTSKHEDINLIFTVLRVRKTNNVNCPFCLEVYLTQFPILYVAFNLSLFLRSLHLLSFYLSIDRDHLSIFLWHYSSAPHAWPSPDLRSHHKVMMTSLMLYHPCICLFPLLIMWPWVNYRWYRWYCSRRTNHKLPVMTRCGDKDFISWSSCVCVCCTKLWYSMDS